MNIVIVKELDDIVFVKVLDDFKNSFRIGFINVSKKVLVFRSNVIPELVLCFYFDGLWKELLELLYVSVEAILGGVVLD